MPAKVTPPFGTYPPKLCENPDCMTGPGNTRATFTPKTPWEDSCCTQCRNHVNYLRRKAERGPARRPPGRPKKSEKSSDQNSNAH